jgi:hypothetical protein
VHDKFNGFVTRFVDEKLFCTAKVVIDKPISTRCNRNKHSVAIGAKFFFISGFLTNFTIRST